MWLFCSDTFSSSRLSLNFCIFFTILFLCASLYAVDLDHEKEASLPVANAVSILYSEDFQSKLLHIDEQVILKALEAFERDIGSYTIVASATNFCVYSNNLSQGLRFMIEPKSFGRYTNKDSGAYQDPSGGDILRFYNVDLKVGLPYFVIVEPNQDATAAGLLGGRNFFTVGGSKKPYGSHLNHLQAGIWGEIDHYDVTSNKSANARFGGCPGEPIVMKIAVLNRDLISVPSGTYVSAFAVNVEAID
ncbi:MAG: hypothetical protein VX737_06005 [Pseudomonadota bacterium]|nr:hypothetical protein [Pseudomonadota bacterium]